MVFKNDIMFTRLPSGGIVPLFRARASRYFYSTSLDIFRAVLEVLFLIVAGIYFTRTMNRWYIKWKQYMAKVYEQQSPRMKTNNL